MLYTARITHGIRMQAEAPGLLAQQLGRLGMPGRRYRVEARGGGAAVVVGAVDVRSDGRGVFVPNPVHAGGRPEQSA